MEKDNKTEIEILKTQFKNIKETLDDIVKKLDTVLKDYVKREEVQAWHERVNTEMDKRFEGVYKVQTLTTANKLDKEEFYKWVEHNERDTKPYSELFWKSVGYVVQLIILGGLMAYFLHK